MMPINPNRVTPAYVNDILEETPMYIKEYDPMKDRSFMNKDGSKSIMNKDGSIEPYKYTGECLSNSRLRHRAFADPADSKKVYVWIDSRRSISDSSEFDKQDTPAIKVAALLKSRGLNVFVKKQDSGEYYVSVEPPISP